MVNFMVYELYISKAIEVTKEKERKEGRKERKEGRRPRTLSHCRLHLRHKLTQVN